MKSVCLLLCAIMIASLSPCAAYAEIPTAVGCVTAYTRSVRGVTAVRMSLRGTDNVGVTYVKNGTLVLYCPSRFTRDIAGAGGRLYLLVRVFSTDGDFRGYGWIRNAATRAFFMILPPVEWE